MAKRKNGKKAGWIGVVLGLTLILISYLIFALGNNSYLQSIQSEIAGAGIVIAVLSAVFLSLNLKVQG